MDRSKILWQVPSLNDHSLDPRAEIVLDLVHRSSAHQSDEARLLNLWKISFQARVMSVWTWIEEIRPEGSNLKEIVWRLPSLHGTWCWAFNFLKNRIQDQSYGRLKMDSQKVWEKPQLDWGSIRSSPRYSLSTPYRLTIRNSARLFHLHHVLFNMVNLHLFLPALNFSTLNAGILIMMQHLCPHWTWWTTLCPSSCCPPGRGDHS